MPRVLAKKRMSSSGRTVDTHASWILRAVFIALLCSTLFPRETRACRTATPNESVAVHENFGNGHLIRQIAGSSAFWQGEIAGFVQGSTGSAALLTQTNLKNRRPDGSIKFTFLSITLPSLRGRLSVEFSFSNLGTESYIGESTLVEMIQLTVSLELDSTTPPVEELIVSQLRSPSRAQSSDSTLVKANFLSCSRCSTRPKIKNRAANTSPQSGGDISSSSGWQEIPNSTLRSVCPTPTPAEAVVGCRAVIEAWNSAVADTKRNRLIIWGGGHNDYWGNELYSLDLNLLKMQRLNDPSPISNVQSCPEAYVDGKPSSRHTYGALSYIAHADRMFVFGGSKSSCGNFSNGTWTLDLETLQWQQMNPSGTHPPGGAGQVSDYDSNSKLVYLHDYVTGLYAYNFDKNSWTLVTPDPYGIDYHMNAVIDPKRKLFIVMGAAASHNGGIQVFNIGSKGGHARQSWSVSGCADLLNSPSPGLAYDPVQDRVVGWPNFGNTVYIFNPDTRTCAAQALPGGPTDSHHAGAPSTTTGTFGRLRYFPDKGVFALVNDADFDAYILRLTPSVQK